MYALRQPTGLKILSFVELLERFGSFSVQSALILYVIQAYQFSDVQAYGLFSAFSALIFATPVIGGYIADKLLGFRRAIIFGCTLYAIGYFALALPNNPYFYSALAFLIWGNGFCKSGVSSFLGTLYHENDPRRDAGFTIFYMCINIGDFLAPIITMLIKQKYGWGHAFAFAGICLVINVITCLVFFRKYFGDHGFSPKPQLLFKKIYGFINVEYILYIILIGFIFLTSYALNYEEAINYGLTVFSLLALTFLMCISFQYTWKERKKLWALLILIFFSFLFWTLYMQAFMSVILFIDRNVDRHFWHWIIPTTMFQSINPLFIVLLSPLFASLWLRLNQTRIKLTKPIKFAIGILCVGLGFLLLTFGISISHTAFISAWWVISLLLLLTIGELNLSPVGISAVTELAPANLTGMLMGVWFLAMAAAYAVGGKIADMTALPKGLKDPTLSLHIYGHNFMYFGLAAVIASAILFLLSPVLKKMIEDSTVILVGASVIA